MPNRGLSLVVCLGLSAWTAAWSQQYTIAPVAGNGSSGFADGAGSAAQFNNPNAIFVDSKGVLYVADTTNNRIRTVTNGTAATINNPGGITVDSAGIVYIGDTGSHVVRKISNGNISVFAGSGNGGYSG